MWVSTIITTIVGSFTCGLLGCSVRILVGLVDMHVSFFVLQKCFLSCIFYQPACTCSVFCIFLSRTHAWVGLCATLDGGIR